VPEPETAEPAPPEPEKAEPAPAAETEVAEIPATPEPEAAEVPAPVPPSAKPRQKPKPPKPVETASTETTASTRRDSPERKPSEERTKPERSEKEFDPMEMAALLNKIDPSGGGGRASTEEASLGSTTPTGPVANMSQSEIDALRAAIEACWTPPVGAEGLDQLTVPIRVEFNIDGSLATDPVAREIPPGPVGQVMAEAALRAVRRCAPYPFLPQEKFETWRTVNINFRPPAMF
jgi:outer membrane biosynthesis protein TonB